MFINQYNIVIIVVTQIELPKCNPEADAIIKKIKSCDISVPIKHRLNT